MEGESIFNGGEQQPAVASFDGVIKGWPIDSLNMLNVPKKRKDFLLYMTCELFKAQHIENPKEQAKKSIEYANAVYNELRSRGILSDDDDDD